MIGAPFRSTPAGTPPSGAVRAVHLLDRLGRLHHRGAPSPDGRLHLALSFDLDYREDSRALPALLEAAGRVGARMTLFSIGRLVAQDPGPYRAAVEAGHEIGNHTWSHPDNPVLCPDRAFWDLSVDEMAAEVGRAQDVFDRLLGVRPSGFRTPHFKDAPRMLAAVARHPEIRYLSSALASKAPLATPYFPLAEPLAGRESLHFSSPDPARNSDLLMIPLTPCPEHRWSPYCSYDGIRRPADPARGAGLHTLDGWTHLWDVMLERARSDGFASVYFDPMDVMRDGRTARAFEDMLRRAADRGWSLMPLRDVERAWRPFLRSGTRSASPAAP